MKGRGMKYGTPLIFFHFPEAKKIFMKKGWLIALVIVANGSLRAQDSTQVLDEVVVTASKTPIKQSQTGKVVTVISKQTIEQNPGKTLTELLSEQAGVTINGATGNLGNNPAIYLRGASSGNTLILLDGIPLYDPSSVSGEFDLNNFDVSLLEKVEILKGAQSTLYGSDAVAGVVNLITKKETSKPFTGSAIAGAGSYGTWKAGATLTGANENGYSFLINYSKLKSAGFSSAYDSTGTAGFDKDGFNSDMFMVRLGAKLSEKTQLSLYGKYSKYGGDIDAGAFMDDKDYTYRNTNLIGGLSFDYHLKNGFVRFLYNANRYKRNFTDDSSHVGGFSKYQYGNYEGMSHYAELYTSLKLSKKVELLAGADYRHNNTDQIYIYLPDYGFPALPIAADSAKTHQVSAYASMQIHTDGGFGLEAGGRFNYQNLYGSNGTVSINPFYKINEHWKIYGTLASAYKIPTLYQLYSEYGNTKLKPETTQSAEAGVMWADKASFVRATGFLRSGRDVILFHTDPVTYMSQYVNGDKQNDQGVEVEGKYAVNNQLAFQLNYTFVDGKITTQNNGKDSSYFNLYKKPKNVLNVGVVYSPLKDLDFGLQLHTASKAYEGQYMAPPFVLKGYYTLGFNVNYSPAEPLSLFVNLANLTNQKYFDTRGYNTRGFNFMAGARVSF